MTDTGDVEDVLAQIHAALEQDGYYVHPSLASEVDAEDRDAIEAGLDDVVAPTYLVAYPLRTNDAFGGNGKDLLTRLHAEYPEPGVYLVNSPADYLDHARLDGRQWDVPGQTSGEPYDVTLTVGYEEPPTVGDAFVRATELMTLSPEELRAANEAARDESYSSGTGGSGGPDGDGGGTGAAVGLTVGLVAVAVVVAVKVGRRRKPPAGSSTTTRPSARGGGRPGFELPAATLSHLRAARDRELRDRARSEVAALGRGIDGTGLAEQRAPVSWQHALDHHAAAERVLERDDPPALLDVVGALVLARRGESALAAARAGRSWEPRPGCYLNPLHTGEVRATRVGTGRDAVRAPLCEDCRDDVKRGRDPDVLDVEHDGAPRHYFETGVEPWATTGFGSLDVDLVGALHGGRR